MLIKENTHFLHLFRKCQECYLMRQDQHVRKIIYKILHFWKGSIWRLRNQIKSRETISLSSQVRETFEFSINVKWLLRNSETFSAKFVFFSSNVDVWYIMYWLACFIDGKNLPSRVKSSIKFKLRAHKTVLHCSIGKPCKTNNHACPMNMGFGHWGHCEQMASYWLRSK